MVKNEGDRLKRVVICPPRKEYFKATDLERQNMNAVPDPAQTDVQFQRLTVVMAESGAEVIEAGELAGHPNSVFTRDTALCTPGGYIRLSMGLEARRGEEKWMAGILEELGEPCAGVIHPPGSVEGGDVILAGKIAFVGHSRRTNREGIRQLKALLKRMDYDVRVVPVPENSLHLGGVMSMIGPDRLVCGSGLFPEGLFKGFDAVNIPLSAHASGNVICLGDGLVIANQAENKRGIEILESQGVAVRALDLSEFRKGGGGPTCLILPQEREELPVGKAPRPVL